MNVAAYARYSSDNQREESIQAQVRAITKYCEDNSLTLIKIYSDNAVTGTSTDDRLEFKKMLQDSDKKIFQKVIVHKLDRFSRDRYDSAIAKKRLKDNGVELISVLENINGSPESIIMESVLEGMAEYYSANLSREVKKGFNENVEQGKYCGGIVPLGLKINAEGKYVVDPVEAELVKTAFQMRVTNHSYPEISKWLNEKGIKFDKQVVKNLLSNEKYIGILRHGRAVNENAIEPIIDIETFQKAQKLKKVFNRHTEDETLQKYLLTGLMTCGLCGNTFAGGKVKRNQIGKKYYYYRCNNRNNNSKNCSCYPVNKEFIEETVVTFIKDNILSKKMLDEISVAMKKKIEQKKDNKDEILGIDIALGKCEGKKKKLLDHLLEDIIDKKTYTEKIKETDREIEFLENKKKELLSIEERVDLSKIKEYLLQLKKNFSSKNFEVRKTIVHTFISQIVVDNEGILIKYSMGSLLMAPPAGFEPTTL